MKKILFNAFKKIFASELEIIQKNSYHEGYNKKSSDDRQFREQIELNELESYIGKPIIAFSNEWDTPVVGIVTGITYITQAKSSALLVKDYIINEEIIVTNKTFAYTEQRFEALLKLNPYELCTLFYSYPSSYIEYDGAKTGVRITNEEIKSKLEENGFFQKIKGTTKPKI